MSNNSTNDYDKLTEVLALTDYLIDGCDRLCDFVEEHFDSFAAVERRNCAIDYTNIVNRAQSEFHTLADSLYEMRIELQERIEELEQDEEEEWE